jgi:hypothetical protein
MADGLAARVSPKNKRVAVALFSIQSQPRKQVGRSRTDGGLQSQSARYQLHGPAAKTGKLFVFLLPGTAGVARLPQALKESKK